MTDPSTVAADLRCHLDVPIEQADRQVRAALADEGFGVLTEIDVQQTLRDKIGAELAPYRILGACNPPLAARAIELDPDIGTMLPCNVLLRGVDGGTEVVVADPAAMVALGSDALQPVADEARARLRSVVAVLR